MSFTKRDISRYTKEKYLTAFLLGFFTLLISVIPVMIADRGYFIYYGDFNAQQIPFYTLINNNVRSGHLGWNWCTDLGSDLLTSYSFYLIGSPFFSLTYLLPRKLISYSLPFILALKHGTASLTAYAYIRRFVRSKNAALTGALLYAFSGFQIYNIFFNHFQDVTALFPLMLIAMEENINNRRRGVFALTVALMAVINYYFFTGQAVFLVIYYLFRMRCSDFRTSWSKFFLLALEAVLGTMIAAAVLLPSIMEILGNYRVNERLYGQNMVLYYDRTRVARIIQTFFMPCDVPARPNLFESDHGKWSSIAGYLPLFSMTGVITFARTRKKHWAVRIVALCGIFACIPILNSAFYTFNASYYARWFYMPILIMAMMTAQTIDDEEADVSFSLRFCAVMIAGFSVISLLPEKINDKLKFFSFPRDMLYYALQAGIAAAFLIAAWYLFRRKKLGKAFRRACVWCTAAASVVCLLAAILYGANTPRDAHRYIDAAINGGDKLYEKVSEDNFFRVDISEDRDNYPMLWGVPSMRAFQSVVSSSIMEFYPKVGVQRDVASRPDTSHYPLRGLFSVKYYYEYKFDEKSKKKNIPEELPGFEYVSENDYFKIYENKLFIPMGIPYDTYIPQKIADKKSPSVLERILPASIVLTDKQAEKYKDILTMRDPSSGTALTKLSYRKICEEKRSTAASSFSYSPEGFTSEISLRKPQLVFFSVPFSKGWTAEVNGKPADVEKVSYGFMAVKADKGENRIVFRYRTPGLVTGLLISAAGIAVLLIYLVICRLFDKKNSFLRNTHSYGYTSCHKVSASEKYISELGKIKNDPTEG